MWEEGMEIWRERILILRRFGHVILKIIIIIRETLLLGILSNSWRVCMKPTLIVKRTTPKLSVNIYWSSGGQLTPLPFSPSATVWMYPGDFSFSFGMTVNVWRNDKYNNFWLTSVVINNIWEIEERRTAERDGEKGLNRCSLINVASALWLYLY